MVNFKKIFKKEKEFTPAEQAKLDAIKHLKLSFSMPLPYEEKTS